MLRMARFNATTSAFKTQALNQLRRVKSKLSGLRGDNRPSARREEENRVFRALSTTTIRLFVPLLAGASLRDRAIGSIGALAGIGLVGVMCVAFFPAATPWIVAPVGASAVLLFAVPASPLAQPWSIVGGNVLSALFGVIVTGLVPEPALAAALAVGGAILAMSLLRCLHPPGGRGIERGDRRAYAGVGACRPPPRSDARKLVAPCRGWRAVSPLFGT
jgi:hypothetical protein